MEKTDNNEISLTELSHETSKPRMSDDFLKILGTLMFIVVVILTVFETVYVGKSMGADKTIAQAFNRAAYSTADYISEAGGTPEITTQAYNPVINLPSIVYATSKHYTQPVQSEYITGVNTSIDAFVFNRGLSYNSQNSIYFLGGEKGNSPLKYEAVAYEKVTQDIDQPTQAKLLKLKQLFDQKSVQFSTKLADSEKRMGHVGIAFAPNTKITFVNLQVGRTEIDLKQEIHLEIGRIAYSKGKVLLGVANAFTGNGKTGGDLFIEIDPDTAIEKFNASFKTSVVVSDVKYWWDKTANIIAGEKYGSANYTRVSGKVDVLDAIGLKANDAVLASRGYVPGGAIFDGVPVTGVRAGGVCYWATAWNTAMRMGLDTYGINYKVLTQSKHYDPEARYAPGTNYPYILGNKDFYDVTVAYSTVYGGVGSITQMEEGKAMDVKTIVLYSNASNGRFLAITEATLAE